MLENNICKECGFSLFDWEKTYCTDCLIKKQNEYIKGLDHNSFVNVIGFNDLTDSHRNLFVKVYQKHLLSMGTNQREKFFPKHLRKVEWNERTNSIHVHFVGNWWHYNNDHTWY